MGFYPGVALFVYAIGLVSDWSPGWPRTGPGNAPTICDLGFQRVDVFMALSESQAFLRTTFPGAQGKAYLSGKALQDSTVFLDVGLNRPRQNS